MGPRVIGLMSVWGRELFVEPAVRQAQELFGADLYVTSTCYLPQLKQYEDNSEAILRSFRKPTYVDCRDVVDFDHDFNVNNGRVLNCLLATADPYPGDYIFLFDVDEFYTETAADEIHRWMQDGDFASLRFKSKFIGPDMDHYVGHAHTRLHRYWKGRRFGLSSTFHPRNETFVLENAPMFHYSLAVDPRSKATFWEYEGAGVDHSLRIEWLQHIFSGYDPEDEEVWMEKNEDLTGHHGFWFDDSCEEAPGGGLLPLNVDHPIFARRYNIPTIGDFREFFEDAPQTFMNGKKPKTVFQSLQKSDESNEPTGPSKCSSSSPAAPPSSRARKSQSPQGATRKSMTVDFYERDTNGCTLVAGPYGGEFGYEVMMWTPALRSLSEYFEKTVVIVREGQKFLYQDFADEILTHSIDLGDEKWRANSGDIKFWNGEWAPFADEELLGEVQNDILSRQYPNPAHLDPMRGLWQMPLTYKSFYSGADRDSAQVAVHPRQAGHGRDWPHGKWNTLVAELQQLGVNVKVVGTEHDYYPGGEDLRSLTLAELAETLSSVSLLIGGSSGVMHFGATCETPLLVWGDADFSIPEVGTSKEAYERTWNPFAVPVQYLDSGWDPDVWSVVGQVKTILKGDT